MAAVGPMRWLEVRAAPGSARFGRQVCAPCTLARRSKQILGVIAHTPQTITDRLLHAQRYAIDFLRLNQARDNVFDGDPLRNESYAVYGDEIFAAAPGIIVAVRNGCPSTRAHRRSLNTLTTWPTSLKKLRVVMELRARSAVRVTVDRCRRQSPSEVAGTSRRTCTSKSWTAQRRADADSPADRPVIGIATERYSYWSRPASRGTPCRIGDGASAGMPSPGRRRRRPSRPDRAPRQGHVAA